ncbi:unnamed protein product [Phytomonas sp. Hart1]|nr:unnamed protein product [Phytomonas sp. Hart1]|eukprot:CCW69599.1 unnamed protein product [Phytomonas sp. isolate Hart1]
MDFQYFDVLHRILLSHLQRGNIMAVLAIVGLPQVHENPLFWRTCTYPEGLVSAMIDASDVAARNNPPDHVKPKRKNYLSTPQRRSNPSEDANEANRSGGKDGPRDLASGRIGPIQSPLTPSELYIMLRWCSSVNLSRIKDARGGSTPEGRDSVPGEEGALQGSRPSTRACGGALLDGDSGLMLFHTLLGQFLACLEHPEGDVCGSMEGDPMPDLLMLSNLLRGHCAQLSYRNPLRSGWVSTEGGSQVREERGRERGRREGGNGPNLRLTSASGVTSSSGLPAPKERTNMGEDVARPSVELRKRARCSEPDDPCAGRRLSTSPSLPKQQPTGSNLDPILRAAAITNPSPKDREVPPQPRSRDGLTRMLKDIVEVKRDVLDPPCEVSALFELLDRFVVEEDALQVLQRVAAVPGTARVVENFDAVGDRPADGRSPAACAVNKPQSPPLLKPTSQPLILLPAGSQGRETSEKFSRRASVKTACHDRISVPSPPPPDFTFRAEVSRCGAIDAKAASPRAPQLRLRHSTTHEERVAAAIRAFDELDSATLYEKGKEDGAAITGHPHYTASVPPSRTIKRRKRFTLEEDEAIIQGVKSFDYQGTTRFQYIFRFYQNVWQPGRTPTHLYDHWRDSLSKRVLKDVAAGHEPSGRVSFTKEASASSLSSEIEEI